MRPMRWRAMKSSSRSSDAGKPSQLSLRTAADGSRATSRRRGSSRAGVATIFSTSRWRSSQASSCHHVRRLRIWAWAASPVPSARDPRPRAVNNAKDAQPAATRARVVALAGDHDLARAGGEEVDGGEHLAEGLRVAVEHEADRADGGLGAARELALARELREPQQVEHVHALARGQRAVLR